RAGTTRTSRHDRHNIAKSSTTRESVASSSSSAVENRINTLTHTRRERERRQVNVSSSNRERERERGALVAVDGTAAGIAEQDRTGNQSMATSEMGATLVGCGARGHHWIFSPGPM